MSAINEVGDFLRYEQNGEYCREVIGGNLKASSSVGDTFKCVVSIYAQYRERVRSAIFEAIPGIDYDQQASVSFYYCKCANAMSKLILAWFSKMTKISALFFYVLVDPVYGVDSTSDLDRVEDFNAYHRTSVDGALAILAKGLAEDEVRDVYVHLDSPYYHRDERKRLFRQKLLQTVNFLQDHNPTFAAMNAVGNLFTLNSYISLMSGQPTFAGASSTQQHAMVYLVSNVFDQPIFSSEPVDGKQFLDTYSNVDVSLWDALVDFLCRNGYKREAAVKMLSTERALCSEHMLGHFVNRDDSLDKRFSGYFVTTAFQNMRENKGIAENIINALFGARMDCMFISQDRSEPSALVLYRRFSLGDVAGLGRDFVAGTQIIAFSSSVKSRIFSHSMGEGSNKIPTIGWWCVENFFGFCISGCYRGGTRGCFKFSATLDSVRGCF